MRNRSLTAGIVSSQSRHLVAAATFLLAAALLVRADDSLANLAPQDVGFFLELRDAGDLLVPLVEPQVWLTVANLTGQPAVFGDTEHWRKRVEETVRMSPAEAVLTLFSRRMALIGGGLQSTQDPVILSRPLGNTRDLLSRWQARPLPTPGRASVYRLPNNVGVAVRENLFIFGDSSAQGLFERVLRQSEPDAPASLAGDPTYQKLLTRVPPNPAGICFMRLHNVPLTSTPATSLPATVPAASAPASAPDTRPAHAPVPELPRLLRGSASLLLALHRDQRLLHVTAVGDAPPATPVPDGNPVELTASLPLRTLFAWTGHINYAELGQTITSLPEMSVIRLAYQLHQRAGTIQRLTAALQPTTCIAVGVVTPANRLVAAPPIPAVAILVNTLDPDAAAGNWGELFDTTLDLYRLLSLKLATPPRIGSPQAIDVAGVPAEQLDLSGLVFTSAELSPLGELHISWTIDGQTLIVASHSDWLRQIIEARHERAPRLSSVLGLSRHLADGRPATVVAAQAGPLADLGKLWLQYFEHAAPQVLKETWWRDYQPRGAEPHLGIQVTEDPAGLRLRVQSVTPDTPADGILKAGDEILGCHPRRFATSQPLTEIKRGLAQRPNGRWIDLIVKRDRAIRVRRIPLPFVDPIEVLRRLIAVGHVVQRVVYLDDIPDNAGASGNLTLELRVSPEPLFPFTITTPTTSVATRPTAASKPSTRPSGMSSPTLEPATQTAPPPLPPATAPAPATRPTTAPVSPATPPSPVAQPAPTSPPTTAPPPPPPLPPASAPTAPPTAPTTLPTPPPASGPAPPPA